MVRPGNFDEWQCFMQDRGQGHCKNNATSGEYFKHDRGQAKGTHKTHKQIPELFSQTITLLIFL